MYLLSFFLKKKDSESSVKTEKPLLDVYETFTIIIPQNRF
jgi:hypothetical protein